MNFYFLLEDEQSFIKILPKWLEYMDFPCQRVEDITRVTQNNYVMQSGQGVTQLITRVLYQTIDTIAAAPEHKIDALIVIVDAEDKEVEERKKQVYDKVENYKRERNKELNFEIKVFVCNHCCESWLLGNRELYPNTQPDQQGNDFYKHYIHYNIRQRDPELMPVPQWHTKSIGQYHFQYLHDACQYNNIRYRKKRPEKVATIDFFNQIVLHINETVHLETFREFYNYIQMVTNEIRLTSI